MHIYIVAIGKNRSKPLIALFEEYKKRLSWKLTLKELPSKKNEPKSSETHRILDSCPDNSIIVALDERGQSLASEEFSNRIEKWQHSGKQNLVFLIGGADGFDPSIEKKANFLLSFGKQTWPHMLVRVMMIEQVYRAQQILSGHPYHRS